MHIIAIYQLPTQLEIQHMTIQINYTQNEGNKYNIFNPIRE